MAVAISIVSLSLPHMSEAKTLEEALAAAYQGNPEILSGRAKLRAVDEQMPQALSGWRPTASASFDTGRSKVESSTATDTRQSRKPHTASLTITQSLYEGGRTESAIRNADNSIIAERARLTDVEQTVLLNGATAFLDVFRAQAVLELNINNEEVLKRQLEATRDRFDVGEITRTDVHQAEARLARATADTIQARGNLKAAQATYLKITGEVSGVLDKPEMHIALPSSAVDSVNIAVENNPGVISAEYDQRAAQDDIASVRGELLPSIDLEGSASRSLNASGESTMNETFAAKVTLTVPLYQSGSVYSRLREARQTAAQLRRDIDTARRDATEEAAQAWENLQTSRARIESFKAQIKAAEVALEGVEREAAVGSRTVLDVLDAEQELLDAKVSIVGAERDEMVAVFQLKSALGELTASHLDLPVERYDEKQHYEKVRNQWAGGAVEDEK